MVRRCRNAALPSCIWPSGWDRGEPSDVSSLRTSLNGETSRPSSGFVVAGRHKPCRVASTHLRVRSSSSWVVCRWSLLLNNQHLKLRRRKAPRSNSCTNRPAGSRLASRRPRWTNAERLSKVREAKSNRSAPIPHSQRSRSTRRLRKSANRHGSRLNRSSRHSNSRN